MISLGRRSAGAAPSQPATTRAAPAAFANEPVLELRRAEVREAALAALAQLDARLPLDVRIEPLAGARAGPAGSRAELAGAHARSAAPAEPVRAPAARARFASVDPCQPGRVVAHADAATAEDVEAAVARAAGDGGRAWAACGAEARAEVLLRAAAILRERRLELAALAVRECAKPWPEADADVCEAIDFLVYYAQGAVALEEGPSLTQPPGERNRLRHAPLGVVAVIAPWNFPFAIATGMTSAALATGNAVVLKPAEQAPACAAAVVAALHEAGVPHGAVQLLPGGDAPGRALVAHPDVHAIAFTGSCAAGLEIVAQAAQTRPGQRHVKRVIAEMGGKNCVIVDADADLDDAVPAIVASAFGFAGQKCSAAARVLVHEAIAQELRNRLKGAVQTLVVGPADDFATDVPAVIDTAAQERIAHYAALGKRTGMVLAEGSVSGTAAAADDVRAGGVTGDDPRACSWIGEDHDRTRPPRQSALTAGNPDRTRPPRQSALTAGNPDRTRPPRQSALTAGNPDRTRPPRQPEPEPTYVPPLLLADLPPDSPLLREEIFGPVLTVETVRDVDTACDRVDALGFALTGGLFSRSPATVEHVARRSPVGNLYVNREITGAMVGRQPFGGNRLSGSGSKAGGPDYLLQFTEAHVLTESTIRHGLVV